MTSIQWLLSSCAVLFGFLSFIWTKKNWFNFILKGVFFALTIWCVIELVTRKF